ncbi:E3 ubiquitin-protein ligase bre1 [Thecaphora frezii]
MATTATEDRKRPLNHVSDVDNGPRKRLQSNAAASGEEESEGEEEEENLWPKYKELEAYRKEAIYRKLLESRRRLSRSNERLRLAQGDLERAEQTTALFGRFWDLLIDDVGSRVPSSERDRLHPIDPHADAEALQQLLRDHVAVIAACIAPSVPTEPQVSRLQQRCHDLAAEAASYKHELLLSKSKLERSERSLRESNLRLSKVEKDFVRSQSEVVRVTEGRKSPRTDNVPQAPGKPAAAAETAKPGGESSPKRGDLVAPGQNAGDLQDQLDRTKEILVLAEKESDARYAEIQGLNDEIKGLKLSLHKFKAQANDIPTERIEATSAYKDLRVKLTQAQDELRNLREKLATLEEDNAQLREDQASLFKSSEADLVARIEALEKTIKSRDSDVTRLRRQRDDLQAELTERRQREQVKFHQIEETKALVNIKEERLALLTSQVKRLRLTVAASRGEQAAVDALLTEADEADQFVKLADAAKVAEAEAERLRCKLAEQGHADANGAGGAAPQPAKNLEAEVKRLQLELRASEASSTALCDEIDRLSAAYSELEKKASNQVVDLTKMENKMMRLVTEKSKADQKFFSTMRVKESLEAENRAALRNTERQTKLIELLTENEKTFAGQLLQHEREVTLLKRAIEEDVKKIGGLEAELEGAKARILEAGRSKAEADESAKKLIDAASNERNARRRLEEKQARLEKDLEHAQKVAARVAAAGGNKVSRKNAEAGEETNVAIKMLQCSTCQERWRSRLITKCFHTFCKECIDSRIQTRQRKCPHCAVPFATSDVQPLYSEFFLVFQEPLRVRVLRGREDGC